MPATTTLRSPRSIVLFPAPVLRRRAAEVAAVDQEIRDLVEDMFRVMKEEDGAGLAAPQVGESLRIFVVAARPDDQEPARAYLNPVIEAMQGDLVPWNEGCLSLPGIRGDIRRPPAVTLRWTELDGTTQVRTDDAMLARIWQHELDHLDGVLIVDRMTPVDRLRARQPLKELKESHPG